MEVCHKDDTNEWDKTENKTENETGEIPSFSISDIMNAYIIYNMVSILPLALPCEDSHRLALPSEAPGPNPA